MRIVETPVIEFDNRNWRLAYSKESPQLIHDAYIPDEISIANWTELLTVITKFGLQNKLLRNIMASFREMLDGRVINGTLNWSVLHETNQEVIYTWTLLNDFATEDQLEIVRIFRGSSGLHFVMYTVRGPLKDSSPPEDWLRRLKAAHVTESARPEPPAPTSGSLAVNDIQVEVERIIEIVQKQPPRCKTEDYIKLCHRAIELIDRDVEPRRWAAFHCFLGAFLQECNDNPSGEDIEAAITAYRRALEIITFDDAPDLWARTMVSLATTFLKRRCGQRIQNIEQAITGYLQAFQVFSLDGMPQDWARTMLSLGSAYEVLGQVGDKEAFQTALSIYNLVLSEATSNPSFKLFVNPGQKDYMKALEEEVAPLVNALHGIYRIDHQLSGNPSFTVSPFKPHGSVLYLRPFQISGTLSIPNKFKGMPWLDLIDLAELDAVTIETLLYAALPTLSFVAIGGRNEGLGGGRIYTTASLNWQELFKIVFKTVDLLIIVPHLSPGMKWEIEFLTGHGELSKCLFVMPPVAVDFDVSQMWQQAIEMMLDYGLHLPQYNGEGKFFRLDSGGHLLEAWPFETIWEKTLIEHLEHLLPQSER